MKTLRQVAGFMLIELAITVLIIAILSVIAVEIYNSQVRKGRRSDGTNAINSISLAEERYRTSNTTYGTIAQVWNSVTTSNAGYYTLAISSISGTGYTITATAVGDQANDTENGTSCTPLTLVVSNGTITRTPSTCWPQ